MRKDRTEYNKAYGKANRPRLRKLKQAAYYRDKTTFAARMKRDHWFRFMRRLNSSLVQLLAQLHFQDNKCPICRRSFDEITRKHNPRTVEHSHEDMRFRGITCRDCNLILGHAKDNIRTLQNAIRYLKGQ